MYEIKNGLLYQDGKAVFAIGQSYYPSFYYNKYPVPPEGDRMGEMVKDLKDMADFGFNHVRFAALGDLSLRPDGSVAVQTDFVDAMCREAQKDGISVSVRLQGYVMNLRGHENIRMIDETGAEQDPKRWFDFIQTTLHHRGMREDNTLSTRALAEHFGAIPGVVGFQIYNEPHYPGRGTFDYHPEAIRAYRRYAVKQGWLTEEEAKDYQPPRTRREQGPEAWAKWRLFSREALTEFLAESAAASKEGSDLPVYTCLTTCQVGTGGSFRGVDCFGNAKWQDVIGYTCYYSAKGADYYPLCLVLDVNASAARLEGKAAWCIEQDARTTVPPLTFNRDAYAAIGAGMKGLLFYQWRGDAPTEGTPEPNGFGLVNYDRSPAPNYDNAKSMVQFLRAMSDKIMGAQVHDTGIGILFSDYAAYLADGKENDLEDLVKTKDNSVIFATQKVYTELRKAHLGVTMIDGDHLKTNPTGIRVLFVPKRAFLSPEEDAAVQAFVAAGGKAYELAAKRRSAIGKGIQGYVTYGADEGFYREFMQLEDVLDLEGLKPPVTSDHYAAPVQVLDGDGYRLIAVTNIAQPERVISPTLTLSFPAKKATIYNSRKEPVTVPVENGRIPLGEVADGCLVVVE